MRLFALACLLALSIAAPAGADDTITADGSSVPVDATALANISDATWPGWVALRRTIAVRDDELATSMLGLDDGQRLGGSFNVVQDALWWRSRGVGAVQVDLERVAWIGPPTLAGQPAPARDRVELVNGDHAEGFVNALQADRGVEVETGTGGGSPQRAWYELGKVASVQLAPRPRAATGWRLWLRDGSVVDADAWRREGSRVTVEGLHLPGAAPRVQLAWEEVLGVQRNSRPVVALAGVDWRAADMPGTPRLAPARVHIEPGVGAFDLRPVDLHGPGTFVARIPEGRWMLDMSIVAPPALARKGACTVQVLSGDRELARTTLVGAAQPVMVHERVEGGELRVVISDSAHGAFGASTRLDRAMLVPVTAGAAASTPSRTSVPASEAGSKGPG